MGRRAGHYSQSDLLYGVSYCSLSSISESVNPVGRVCHQRDFHEHVSCNPTGLVQDLSRILKMLDHVGEDCQIKFVALVRNIVSVEEPALGQRLDISSANSQADCASLSFKNITIVTKARTKPAL